LTPPLVDAAFAMEAMPFKHPHASHVSKSEFGQDLLCLLHVLEFGNSITMEFLNFENFSLSNFCLWWRFGKKYGKNFQDPKFFP
jgi:hypothetical protein